MFPTSVTHSLSWCSPQLALPWVLGDQSTLFPGGKLSTPRWAECHRAPERGPEGDPTPVHVAAAPQSPADSWEWVWAGRGLCLDSWTQQLSTHSVQRQWGDSHHRANLLVKLLWVSIHAVPSLWQPIIQRGTKVSSPFTFPAPNCPVSLGLYKQLSSNNVQALTFEHVILCVS